MKPQSRETAIAHHFARKLGAPFELLSLKQSFPGISRETWMIRGEVSGKAEGFVLRVDPPEGGGGPHPMRFEWDIYRTLHASEVPVAEPLWYDHGIDFVEGRAHMVRRLVDGSTTVDGLFDPGPESAKLRRRVAFECVEKLALVHRLDWKAHGLDSLISAPDSPAQSFQHELDIWRGYWEAFGPVPTPVLDETLCWLETLVPHDTPRISLTKGNNGLGEEIWLGDKIVAMSDWELAALGDGVSDLFWSQGTLRLIDFADIVEHYAACMGHAVSFERLAFAGIYALAKQLMCGLAFWYRPYHEGRTKRIYALSGRTYQYEKEYRLSRCIGKPLDEAWAIVSKTEKSMYAKLGGTKQ